MDTPPCRTKSAVRNRERIWFFFIPPSMVAIIFNKSLPGRQRGVGQRKTRSCATPLKAFTARNNRSGTEAPAGPGRCAWNRYAEDPVIAEAVVAVVSVAMLLMQAIRLPLQIHASFLYITGRVGPGRVNPARQRSSSRS